VAVVKSKEACKLETNAAWGNESDWERLGTLLISPQEPTVKTDIEGHHIDFVLDTWEAISTMTTPTGRLTKDSITIRGATGNTKKHQFWNPKNAWSADTRSSTGFCTCQKLQAPFWEEIYFLNHIYGSGTPDVSILPVLTLEVSLEEERHIHTPGTINPSILSHS
jgi:hypothetical protein